MKIIIWIGVIGLSVVIQSSLLPLFSFRGIRPDLLLVIVVISALLSGKERGTGIGFFCGLIQDLASGGIFGLHTLSKMATGYLFGLAESKVFKEHILLPIMAAALATVVNQMVLFFVLFLLGYRVDVISALYNQIGPLISYNMLVAIPLYKIVYKITKIS